MKKKFATALNCIDGRTQLPVTNWMIEHFGVNYVDLVTEPGIDLVLSHGPYSEIERIRDKAIVSINAHNSQVIAIVGHYDCAANPVSDSQHIKYILESIRTVRSWCLPAHVIGLFVDRNWHVHVVAP